jgi:predicted transcriptional regulator
MNTTAKGNGASDSDVRKSRTQSADKTVAARLDPSFWTRLKQISIDHDRSVKNLLQESLNDLFLKYGLSPIASSDEASIGTTTKQRAGGAERDSGKFRVQISFTISKQLDGMLEKLAYENDTNKNEILRKAFVLFEVANEAKDQGNKLGILSRDRKVLAEIVGL